MNGNASYDDSQLRNVSAERKRVADQNKAKFSEAAKQKLVETAKKKMTTTFIGCLSQFEKKFGFLWGYQDKGAELTDDELDLKDILNAEGFGEEYFKRLWEEARTNILHAGNSQSRALQEEIGQHIIGFNRYTLTMPVRKTDT